MNDEHLFSQNSYLISSKIWCNYKVISHETVYGVTIVVYKRELQI